MLKLYASYVNLTTAFFYDIIIVGGKENEILFYEKYWSI